jgi:hypothetical protein
VTAIVQTLALEFENKLLAEPPQFAVGCISGDEVESTEAGRRRPDRLRNAHRLRRCFHHATHIDGVSIRSSRWIEHRAGDQWLEEVAMHIEVLEDDLLEQRLEVEPRLVPVDVRIPVQGQNSADVGVLEFDGAFRSIPKQPPKTLVVLRLVDAQAGQLVAEQREVIADRGLDFLTRPIVAGHPSAPHVVREL